MTIVQIVEDAMQGVDRFQGPQQIVTPPMWGTNALAVRHGKEDLTTIEKVIKIIVAHSQHHMAW
jgi:hypothetical protein